MRKGCKIALFVVGGLVGLVVLLFAMVLTLANGEGGESTDGSTRTVAEAQATRTPRPTRTPIPSKTPTDTRTPKPTDTPRPTRTPRPTNTPTEIPVGADPSKPHPAGQPVEWNGIRLEVGVPRPVTQAVKAANMFNPRPEAGSEFILVPVTITNIKDGSTYYVSRSDYDLVGDLRRVYSPIINIVMDGQLDSDIALMSGGSVSGGLIFEVDKKDTGLLLEYEELLSFDRGIYIALPAPAE